MPGVKVLVVEDNPLDRELTIRALRENGFGDNIVTASDGVEAADIIRSHLAGELTLALVDLKLPRVDGFEVIKTIRSNPVTRNLPVVVFSSSDEAGDIRRSYELGANSYAVKPILYDDINRVIGALATYWNTINRTAVPSTEHLQRIP